MAAQTKLNPLQKLRDSGQSPWMDSLRRGWITSGELEKMIREDGISGITVNPTVYERAISDSSDYDDAIRELVRHGTGIPQIYEALLVEDIRAAADLLRSAYDAADGADGFVSVNLPPSLAFDTIGSIREAHRLQSLIDRSNIMFNIPATPQGLPAIEELTYDGVNVNATFLFFIDVYEKAARAYIRALERRAEDDEPLNRAASMASFFVSRLDVEVDTQLEEMISRTGDSDQRLKLDLLLGKAAIANAKLAYKRFMDIFSEDRFKDLESQGARVQRLIWASTGTKSPRYPREYYVENLIGPNT
ncbi:MAG TPA: transaldolase family protein, partial [Armatimonadota bacterium]